jgi:F0F1-type ATP synthase membrane subunit b/b'
MEDILTNLHLDLTALLWHSANFLLVVAILWLLVFRPFARVVEQRQRRIHESLARADEIDRLDGIAEAKRKAVIAAANKEATEIRRRAHEESDRYTRSARVRANAEVTRIRERATQRHSARP